MIDRKLIIAALCMGMAQAAAAQVPHTFSAGSPARAAEVNENFTALTSQIAALSGQLAELRKVGTVYVTRACDSGCHVVAVGHDFPNPNGFAPVASLRVPEDGNYLVLAKLTVRPSDPYVALGFNFNCRLADASLAAGSWDSRVADTGSISIWHLDQWGITETPQGHGVQLESMAHLQLPISYRTGSGGTVSVSCMADGLFATGDNSSFIDMYAWGVSIVAIRVSSITVVPAQ